MAEEIQDKLRVSHYDGIQEYDNSLPRWWLGTFFITLIFGVFYWLYYYTFAIGPNQTKEYDLAMTHLQTQQQSAPQKSEVTDDGLLAMVKQDTHIKAGQAIYQTNCVACHGQKGEGGVGPNMTDKYWIHGGAPLAIYKTIVSGVPEKGMISWKGILTEQQIQQVTAVLLTMKNTNVDNGKAPQGNPE